MLNEKFSTYALIDGAALSFEDMLKTKFFKIVQRKFSFNIFSNRSQIFKLGTNFEAHGTCEDHRLPGSLPSGTPISIGNPATLLGFKSQSIVVRANLCDARAINLASLRLLYSSLWLRI